MRGFLHSSLLIAGFALTSCSQVVNDKDQYLRIETPNAQGASCRISDYREYHWKIAKTPDTIRVDKGYPPLRVTCSLEGYETTSISSDMRYNPMVPGDFIADKLGYIFADYRHASDDYPPTLVLWMKPKNFESYEAEQLWQNKVADYYKEEALRLEREDKTIKGKAKYTRKQIDEYIEKRRHEGEKG